MTKRKNISISFTQEQTAFMTACVESGRYQSTSEVVREAVRLLEDRQQARLQAEIEQARREIAIGAEQLETGRTIDGATFFAEWDTELDALEAAGQSRNTG